MFHSLGLQAILETGLELPQLFFRFRVDRSAVSWTGLVAGLWADLLIVLAEAHALVGGAGTGTGACVVGHLGRRRGSGQCKDCKGDSHFGRQMRRGTTSPLFPPRFSVCLAGRSCLQAYGLE